MSMDQVHPPPAIETPQPLKIRSLASYIFILGALVFLTHVISIVILDTLNTHNHLLEILIDALIMLALLMPGLYFLQTRPLLKHIEERTQMEQTIRTNEELFRKVLELLPVGVGVLDRHGNLVHGNPAGEQIWGGLHYVGIEQFGEYKVFSLDSGEPLALEQRAVSKAIKLGQTTLNQELEIETFAGQRKVILNSAVPILDQQQEIQGAIIIQQDITARKKAEQDLQQSEELFRTTVDTLPIGVWLADASGKIIYVNPAGKEIWAGVRYVGIDEFGEYKGWWLNSGKPIQPDEWAIARAIRNEEKSFNEEIEIECFDGTHKIVLNSAFPLYDHKKRIAGAYVTNQDITAQKHAAETLSRQNEELILVSAAEKKQRQLAETLTQSIIALNRSLELDHVINTLLDHLNRIAPADIAVVHLFEDETQPRVQVVRGYGEWEQQAAQYVLSRDNATDSIFEHLDEMPKSVFHANLADEYIRAHSQKLHDPDTALIRDWLLIPLRANESLIGLVELGIGGSKRMSTSVDTDVLIRFDDEQIQGLEALVGQATVVIQNARLFEQVRASRERAQALARKLVVLQENERSYISRELHDEAGQALSSLKLNLSRLEQDPLCPPAIKARLEDLKGVTDQILDELHRLVMDLRPAALDHLGLVAALEQYTRGLNSETLSIQFKALGFDEDALRMSTSDGERLPKDLEVPLYRIVQEALTNVIRHASASNVGILLERGGGKVKVFIEDDGVGLQQERLALLDRMGLVGMRERAEMLGGSLSIESATGEGTSIIVEVPYGDSHPDRR